jgi:predicted alpha/beta-hydrolase family hydrolase
VAAELVSRHHEGEGLLASGLVLLGYPLHAPGRKDRLKLEPLRRIDVPSLFVEGTRDPFCDLDLLRPVIAAFDVPGTLHVVEGGDHSVELPRSSSRTLADVHGEVAGVVARFITEHAG